MGSSLMVVLMNFSVHLCLVHVLAGAWQCRVTANFLRAFSETFKEMLAKNSAMSALSCRV